MKNLPLVSILIPTYNQPEYFRQALESALNQTYPNIEIIVSDDSTDDRVAKVASEYSDKIQFYKHKTDKKLAIERSAANVENLLRLSHGEFVNLLFHDDIIYPEKISRMMEYFLRDDSDQIAIVTSRRDAINDDGSLRDFDEFYIKSKTGDSFMPSDEIGRMTLMLCVNVIGEFSTVLIRRNDFYRDYVNKFTTTYFLGVHDQTMGDVPTFLESFKDGRGIVFINEPLSAFRLGTDSQHSTDARVRMTLAMDWISFIAAGYLCDVYLKTFEDFSYACDSWIHRVCDAIFNSTVGTARFNNDIPLDLIDALLQTIESADFY